MESNEIPEGWDFIDVIERITRLETRFEELLSRMDKDSARVRAQWQFIIGAAVTIFAALAKLLIK